MIRTALPLLALTACAAPPAAAPPVVEGTPQTTLSCAIYFAISGRAQMSDAFSQVHARQTGRSLASIVAETTAFRDDPQTIDPPVLREMTRICERQTALYPETRAAS